jgi:hypothetical protein
VLPRSVCGFASLRPEPGHVLADGLDASTRVGPPGEPVHDARATRGTAPLPALVERRRPLAVLRVCAVRAPLTEGRAIRAIDEPQAFRALGPALPLSRAMRA